jgi:hypothetical protein
VSVFWVLIFWECLFWGEVGPFWGYRFFMVFGLLGMTVYWGCRSFGDVGILGEGILRVDLLGVG